MDSRSVSDTLATVSILGFAPVRGRLHLAPAVPVDGDALKEGRLRPASPLRFRRDSGKRVVDLLDTTWAVLEVVSPRVVQALRAAGATGWHPVPVAVEGVTPPLEGYAVLAVTGRSGALDWSGAREITRPPPVPTGQPVRVRVGPALHPGEWDGSDVFLPGGSLTPCVTAKVRRALESADVEGFRFTPLAEYENDWDDF